MATIDVWMQHPTPEFLRHEMFSSLRRWMGEVDVERELPLSMTVELMERAGIGYGLLSAWCGPEGELIARSRPAAGLVPQRRSSSGISEREAISSLA